MARFCLPEGSNLALNLASWVFAHSSFALPVDRLLETTQWTAFYHPKPSYPLHFLFVPKKAIANLSEVDASDPSLINGLVVIVMQWVNQFDLQSRS